VRKIYIIVCLFIWAFSLKAQDIHFSQLNQTPLLLNPASTGVYDGYYRAILNYKNQWAVMGKPYSTFMGSFDMPIELKRNKKGAQLGLGAFLFSDKAGDSHFSTTQVNLSLSGIVPIGNFNTLSAGIEAGIVYQSVDIAAIQWPNQYNGQTYDPGISSNELGSLGSYTYFDLAAGLHYQFLKYRNFFSGKEMVCFTAGAALFHATKPWHHLYNGVNGNTYPRIVIHSSLRYDFKGSGVGIVPSVLYMSQGPVNEIDVGLLLRFRTSRGTKITGFLTESAFSAGLSYRYKDAIVPQIFFEISNFGIGLSYDVNVSSFANASKYNGGIEVSIWYSKMRGALYKNKR
jgi:type IX secretion system PorP/SprF family membrane protein